MHRTRSHSADRFQNPVYVQQEETLLSDLTNISRNSTGYRNCFYAGLIVLIIRGIVDNYRFHGVTILTYVKLSHHF